MTRTRWGCIAAGALALMSAATGCGTLFDTDEVAFEGGDVLDTVDDVEPSDTSDTAAQDTLADGDTAQVDAEDTLEPGDTAEPLDLTDVADDDLSDVLDCAGRCGAEANCQPCDGQCVDLRSDVQNCGACGSDCTGLPHVDNASCDAGICHIPNVGGCDAGYADCDGNVANGCEQDTTADNAHCGACDNACPLLPLPQECVSGTCQ